MNDPATLAASSVFPALVINPLRVTSFLPSSDMIVTPSELRHCKPRPKAKLTWKGHVILHAYTRTWKRWPPRCGTDHSFSDHRIALQTIVIDWLQQLQ